MTLLPYDQHAIKEIHAWKDPQIGWFGQVMKVINWPLDKAGDLILATPGLGDAIKAAIQGLTGVCNDVAHWSVQKDAIYSEFHKHGHRNVNKAGDVHSLNLEDVDRVVSWLDAKYKGIALAEGAASGALGLPGIAPDLIALIAMNLRAIAEYATYYGFDIQRQEERLFAMNVLGLASSPTDASKGLAMAQLVRISQDVAKKRAWKELEKHAFVQVIQQISKALGVRLTKAKLAQIIPVGGALIGGGFNAYFTSKVCDAAFYLYRERFLAARYGVDIIEVTVQPATKVDPEYPEEFEHIPGLTNQ